MSSQPVEFPFTDCGTLTLELREQVCLHALSERASSGKYQGSNGNSICRRYIVRGGELVGDWFVRLAVRMPGSHPGDRGAIPRRITELSSECAGLARNLAKVVDQVRFLAGILFVLLGCGVTVAHRTFNPGGESSTLSGPTDLVSGPGRVL